MQQLTYKTKLKGNEKYKVRYKQHCDKVVLELGGVTLTLDVQNFMMLNEMMRKAAARLVMQGDSHSQ